MFHIYISAGKLAGKRLGGAKIEKNFSGYGEGSQARGRMHPSAQVAELYSSNSDVHRPKTTRCG